MYEWVKAGVTADALLKAGTGLATGRLGDDGGDDFSGDIRQAEVAAIVAVG